MIVEYFSSGGRARFSLFEFSLAPNSELRLRTAKGLFKKCSIIDLQCCVNFCYTMK